MRSGAVSTHGWGLNLSVAWQPMPLPIKRVMHIHRGVKIGIRLIVTHWTPEQFPPLRFDTFVAKIGQHLPLGAATRAILTGPMWIHLDRDYLLNIGFLFGVFSDLAAQLVRTPAVHAPRFAARTGLELAQALEE